MDALHRALLRWSGRNAELVRLRGLVRYGHVMGAGERWMVERVLGTPDAGRFPAADDEESASVKIGQPASSIECWDAGTYPGKVVEVVEEPAEQSKFGKPRLKWIIRATDPDGETQDLWYWTNCTLSRHQNATFRPFVKAVAPDLDLDDPDLEVDTDALVGARCRLIVGVNEEKGRNVVDKVLPAEARKVARPAKEAVVVGGEEVPF